MSTTDIASMLQAMVAKRKAIALGIVAIPVSLATLWLIHALGCSTTCWRKWYAVNLFIEMRKTPVSTESRAANEDRPREVTDSR